MPLLSTSGADCAQGYGFGVGSSTSLITYTFPSGTSTWTAPLGVTNLVSVVGRGSDGRAATFFVGYVGGSTIFVSPPPPSGSALDWSTVYSEAQASLAQANAGGTDFRTISPLNTRRYVNASNQVGPADTFSITFQVIGTSVLEAFGSAKTSGPVLFSEGFGSWEVRSFIYDPGSNGNPTTGFGLTFPGGTIASPTAPTTTFNNVTVVPGTTYTIDNRQSLVITYFA